MCVVDPKERLAGITRVVYQPRKLLCVLYHQRMFGNGREIWERMSKEMENITDRYQNIKHQGNAEGIRVCIPPLFEALMNWKNNTRLN